MTGYNANFCKLGCPPHSVTADRSETVTDSARSAGATPAQNSWSKTRLATVARGFIIGFRDYLLRRVPPEPSRRGSNEPYIAIETTAVVFCTHGPVWT